MIQIRSYLQKKWGILATPHTGEKNFLFPLLLQTFSIFVVLKRKKTHSISKNDIKNMGKDLMSNGKSCGFMYRISHLKFHLVVFCSFWKELHKMCCLYLSFTETIKHLHYRMKRKKYNSFSLHRES